jgi:hypothetical protein
MPWNRFLSSINVKNTGSVSLLALNALQAVITKVYANSRMIEYKVFITVKTTPAINEKLRPSFLYFGAQMNSDP